LLHARPKPHPTPLALPTPAHQSAHDREDAAHWESPLLLLSADTDPTSGLLSLPEFPPLSPLNESPSPHQRKRSEARRALLSSDNCILCFFHSHFYTHIWFMPMQYTYAFMTNTVRDVPVRVMLSSLDLGKYLDNYTGDYNYKRKKNRASHKYTYLSYRQGDEKTRNFDLRATEAQTPRFFPAG